MRLRCLFACRGCRTAFQFQLFRKCSKESSLRHPCYCAVACAHKHKVPCTARQGTVWRALHQALRGEHLAPGFLRLVSASAVFDADLRAAMRCALRLWHCSAEHSRAHAYGPFPQNPKSRVCSTPGPNANVRTNQHYTAAPSLPPRPLRVCHHDKAQQHALAWPRAPVRGLHGCHGPRPCTRSTRNSPRHPSPRIPVSRAPSMRARASGPNVRQLVLPRHRLVPHPRYAGLALCPPPPHSSSSMPSSSSSS